jgi:hypothetical protein
LALFSFRVSAARKNFKTFEWPPRSEESWNAKPASLIQVKPGASPAAQRFGDLSLAAREGDDTFV